MSKAKAMKTTTLRRRMSGLRNAMVRRLEDRGFKKADLGLFDEFDLSMLLDGYSPDEVSGLRKPYF